jgi:hypothetical protein
MFLNFSYSKNIRNCFMYVPAGGRPLTPFEKHCCIRPTCIYWMYFQLTILVTCIKLNFQCPLLFSTAARALWPTDSTFIQPDVILDKAKNKIAGGSIIESSKTPITYCDFQNQVCKINYEAVSILNYTSRIINTGEASTVQLLEFLNLALRNASEAIIFAHQPSYTNKKT